MDFNLCLFEHDSKCSETSSQQELLPDNRRPLIVTGETYTLVGVQVKEQYACSCGPLDPIPTACPDDFCLNGGTCKSTSEGLQCECLDDQNYGPRCELITALFKEGFAWFDPLDACLNPALELTFNSETPSGLILYNGPLVPPPYLGYPKDFLYVALQEWTVSAYLELGEGGLRVSVPLKRDEKRAYNLRLSWDHRGLNMSIPNCGLNSTESPNACHSSVRYPNPVNSSILNVGGPLQLGGLAPMLSLSDLGRTHDWQFSLPHVKAFEGCVSSLKYNGDLIDLNKTTYNKYFHRTCNPIVPPAEIRMSNESVFIIVGSLIVLMGKLF